MCLNTLYFLVLGCCTIWTGLLFTGACGYTVGSADPVHQGIKGQVSRPSERSLPAEGSPRPSDDDGDADDDDDNDDNDDDEGVAVQ